MNHLEQLVAEWYEYNGYFVRRNVYVGKRAKGGYECELDVIAFHPENAHLVHVEPSMDAHTWVKREERYKKKFSAGKKYIPQIFTGLAIPDHIEQIALLGFASNKNVKELAGGKIVTVADLYLDITNGLRGKKISQNAVPEQFSLLRTIQYCVDNETRLFGK